MLRKSFVPAALLMSACLMGTPSYAQKPGNDPGKTITKDETVIIRNDDDNGKTIVEIKNGNIYVNGRLMMSVRDDDATRVHKKIIIENDDADDDRGPHANAMIPPFPKQAKLGVMARDGRNESGALVAQVAPGSAAEAAGLKAGDVINRVDDEQVEDADDLVRIIRNHHQPGDKVTLSYRRNNKQFHTNAQLTEAQPPATADRFPMPYSMQPFQFPSDHFPSLSDDFFGNRPRLGATVEDRADGQGVTVIQVQPGSAAAQAGLQHGDVITQLNQTNIRSVDGLQQALQQLEDGSKAELSYSREGHQATVMLHLSEPPKRMQL